MEEAEDFCSEYNTDGSSRTVGENDIRVWRADGPGQWSLTRIQSTKHKKASPEAVKCREGRSQVGLMDAARPRNGDDGVAASRFDVTRRVFSLILWPVCLVQKTPFEFHSFSSAEVIARTHNVGSISVHGWIKSHVPEHGEHLSRMSAAAQGNKDMGGSVLWPKFRDISILGDCKGMEKELL